MVYPVWLMNEDKAPGNVTSTPTGLTRREKLTLIHQVLAVASVFRKLTIALF